MSHKSLLSIAVCMLFVACSSHGEQNATSASTPADSSVTVDSLSMPLPIVPASLREPAERAAYIMNHFWDTLQFTDTVRSLNNDFVEQNFSNFISLFPLASVDDQAAAVHVLLTRAAANADAYKLMLETARKYLYDPNSPMYNEDQYSVFVNTALASKATALAERERMATEREWIAKNRVGTTATNFRYRTLSGEVTTLLQTPVSGQMLLVLYDPTCESCHEILKQISENKAINQAIAAGELTLLAINLLADTPPSDLPKTWLTGTDLSNIQDDELYVIRATPSLYILDTSHTIIAKDIQPSAIL